MFENTGLKIREVGTTFCIVGIVADVISGALVFWTGLRENSWVFILSGIGIATVGSLLCWLMSLLAVGLGDLIASQQHTEQLEQEILRKI